MDRCDVIKIIKVYNLHSNIGNYKYPANL